MFSSRTEKTKYHQFQRWQNGLGSKLMLYSLRQLQNKCSQHIQFLCFTLFSLSPCSLALWPGPALWCSVSSVCTIWQTLAPHIQARLLWTQWNWLGETVVNNPRVQLDLFRISMTLPTCSHKSSLFSDTLSHVTGLRNAMWCEPRHGVTARARCHAQRGRRAPQEQMWSFEFSPGLVFRHNCDKY